ncbi:MAG: hypothetical protein BGO98_13910 [Myxococcales bacterium 68-20]|nr:MAG: hypothetical protein BGO98_13910 [Myxococcales bacterium 68-20]
MLPSWRRLAFALTVPALLATACATEVEETDSSSDEINYRSTAGQEFTLSTTVRFAAPAAAQDLEGEARELAVVARAEALRTTVTSAISAELDRIWPEAQRLTRAGLVIQFRQASATYSDLKASEDGARYEMVVSGEFAGVNDLEQKLPLRIEGGKKFLPVTASVDGESQQLEIVLTPVERSRNAYPKYLELFEGGLDIAVHVGGDHHDPPQDIEHARSIYDDLVASGFRSPVRSFAELAIDSPPFTSRINVKGESVDVRVRLFHVDMTTSEMRQPLIDAYKESMKSADVVIYDGHAGRSLDYSGVVFAYKPARVAIPAGKFKDIESNGKQQVYLFNGCETYTGYADKLYENPARNPANTDIITTGNYSAIQRKANQVISFIHSFIDQRSGTWVPRSWDSVLSRMNAVGERSWVHVYGVHGIDDNPKVSPLADVSKVGVACRSNADCGSADSRCIAVSSNRRVCGVACADSAGCPSGTRCMLPRGQSSLDEMQCARQ